MKLYIQLFYYKYKLRFKLQRERDRRDERKQILNHFVEVEIVFMRKSTI